MTGTVTVTWQDENGRDYPANATTPLPVTNGGSGTSAQQVQGNVAHDAADSGNPVKIGGYASTTAPTAVSAGADRVNAWYNLNGAAVVGGQYRSSPGILSDNVSVPIQLDRYGSVRAMMTGLFNTVADGASNTSVNVRSEDSTAGAPLGVYNSVFNGTTWDRQRGDTAGTLVQSSLTANRIYYSSGISRILSNTTTAVTIFASAGGSLRNYISSIQINTDPFTTASPIAIRDGAGGAVLWSLAIGTAGWLLPVVITFDPPLKGTAATLLEIVTTTASTTGGVSVNAQGFTAL